MEASYQQITEDHLEGLIDQFIESEGDENGIISDVEFDRLFDDLARLLERAASFSEENEPPCNFHSSRYVDQIPFIQIVAGKSTDLELALKVGLEAVRNSHRPLALGFEFERGFLLALSPDQVFGTFPVEEIIPCV